MIFRWAILLTVYLAAAGATAGVVAAGRQDMCAARWHNELNPRVMILREACVRETSVRAAVIWPVYWVAKIAQKVAQ